MRKLEFNPTPLNNISPRLFMQFMEPLGTTDSSVEAAWDFTTNQWRDNFVDVVRDLAPGCIRWGGIYTSFWKWREGIGPRENRVPAINYLWGGVETNQIGVHEILEFCQKVSAEPLMAINFAADGRPEYINTADGEQRAGTPEEAADLVSYCNDPDNLERQQNGVAAPWNIKLWQIGNETSYNPAGRRFTAEENAQQYRLFAETMRQRDPSIQLIGWGDAERDGENWWVSELLKTAGDQVDFVAAHMMQQRARREDTILIGRDYMKDRDQAWAELTEIYDTLEPKLNTLEQIIKANDSAAKIALTEGHLSLNPHNTIQLLHEWLAGLYHARVMNLYLRHSDMIEVATLADFCGNRWTVNAVMMGSQHQQIYLMPVGVVTRLYRKHSGEKKVKVPATIGSLDLAASRTGNEIYLHVVNTDLHNAQSLELTIPDVTIMGGKAWEIAPGDIAAYVDSDHTDTLDPVVKDIVSDNGQLTWVFPAASVTVLMLTV